MSLGEITRTSLSEIRHNKLRSGLTLLGIILGTLSITVMTSFLDGVISAVWSGFEDLGYDGVMYVVERSPADMREKAIFERSRGLQQEDANFLMERGGAVEAVAPVAFTEDLVRRGNLERKARVMGATESYNLVRNRKMMSGRFVSDLDNRSFARVCVLGYRLSRRLFGTEDAVGKTVAIGGRSFLVIGVGKKLGNTFVDDDEFIEEMEGVTVPLATLRKFYSGPDEPLAFLAVKTKDIDHLDALKAETVASLRIAHRGAQDFRVQNIAEQMLRERKAVTEVLMNWRIVLGSIAGISLIVGGIGLLSVLLISIGERLYEIGLRKALGATDTEIFVQFLSESIILSVIGGLVGAAGGILITKAASGFFPSGLPVRVSGLLLAIGIAVALGILYGIYPALKASRMEPVEAIRSAA